MTLLRAAILAVVVTASMARAHANTVTVVTTGDADLQAKVSSAVEGWLRGHGHTLGPPLAAEPTNTLLNCMVMDDQACARGLVEARVKAEAVLFAEVIRSRGTNGAIVINVYWIPKGREPIGMRRACEDCSAALMKSTLDEALDTVVGAGKLEHGRVEIHSKPEGMSVLLDNETVGVTPLEREVATGEHMIVLMHRGQKVGEKKLKVMADVTAEITVPVTVPVDDEMSEHTSSRLVPGLVLGGGATALVAGVVLYATSETDDGTKPTYRDTRPLGLGLAVGGIALAGVGAWLWIRAGHASESAPVATLTSSGGIVGWSRAF